MFSLWRKMIRAVYKMLLALGFRMRFELADSDTPSPDRTYGA